MYQGGELVFFNARRIGRSIVGWKDQNYRGWRKDYGLQSRENGNWGEGISLPLLGSPAHPLPLLPVWQEMGNL